MLFAVSFVQQPVKDIKDLNLRNNLIITLILFFTASAEAQTLSGWVIDKKTLETIPVVHVVNKSTYKGTVTDENGYFEIDIQPGDTMVFSNIAYKYYYFIYTDKSQPLKEVLVELEEQNYMLHEVSVFSYELTTNDPKEMKLNKPRVPSNDEIREERIINATAANPAEFLYNLFGSKPKELRKLAELKAEDAYREKLKESNNRESVVDLTGLSKDELEAFMFYCKYAPVHMQTMNDYEFLKSVQYCYRQYIKERELEDFLQQFD